MFTNQHAVEGESFTNYLRLIYGTSGQAVICTTVSERSHPLMVAELSIVALTLNQIEPPASRCSSNTFAATPTGNVPIRVLFTSGRVRTLIDPCPISTNTLHRNEGVGVIVGVTVGVLVGVGVGV